MTFSFTASGKQYYINFSVAEAVTPPSENKYTIPLEGNTDISNIIINGVTIKDYAVSEDGLTVDVVLDENTAKDVEAKVQLEVIAGFLQINPVSDYATFAGAIYTGAGITAEGPAKLTDGKVTFSFTASGKQYYINFSVAETVIPPSEDEIATNEVIEVINALPKLETLTTADADKVKAARDAYEALTKEQKAMVSEELVKQLTEVEAKISELKKAEEEQQKAEEVAAANKAAAGTVANAVSALPVADKLIAADADAVKAARAAYEALTDAQKALVSTDTLKQLEEAEAKIAELTHVHSWDKGTVVSEATVKAAEVRKFTCTTCKETKEEGVGETLTPVLEIPGKLSSFNMKKGKTAKFTVTMANGDSVTSVKSSKSKILKATLDKKTGKITVKGVKKGTSKLTITLASGKTRTYKVKVVTGTVKTKGVTVTSVTEQKLTLNVKKTHTLKSELKPFTSTQKLTYKSSNKKIAKVSSKGKITAVAPGKATITVASGSKKVKITVTVPGITNLKSSVSVKKNKTLTLKPKTYGISEKVTYTSSNTKVATITANGKIKGIKKGTAKITVKAGTFKKTVTVKVK